MEKGGYSFRTLIVEDKNLIHNICFLSEYLGFWMRESKTTCFSSLKKVQNSFFRTVVCFPNISLL